MRRRTALRQILAVPAGLYLAGKSSEAQTTSMSCVQYVKSQKPEYAGEFWNNKHWENARDLFDLVYNPKKANTNRNRGYVPTVGSVFVIDKFGQEGTPSATAGHAGIVTSIKERDSKGYVVSFVVSHAAWTPGKIETGTFKFETKNSVSYEGGKKHYPLRGFVYGANGAKK